MLFYCKSLNPNWSNIPSSPSFISLWILLVFHPEDVSAVILKSPSNTTAIVGHRFELNCSANKATIQWIDWSFFQNSHLTYSDYNQPCTPSILSEADDEKCIKIVSSGEISESQEKRYNASNNSTENEFSSTLSVEVVDLSYAGVYQCADADTSSSTAYAFLTVIDPNTNCTLISNSTAFNCSFAYSGLPPNLRWNSIGSNSTINCTQEEFNIVCIIQFPSFQQIELSSCHLEIGKGAQISEKSSIRIEINNFNATLVGFLLCHYDKTTETTTNSVVYFTDETTHWVMSSESVIIPIAVISGVAVVVIIALVFLRKGAATEPVQSLNQQNQETQQNDGYELFEVAADISPSAEYSSLQQNFALESPVYTELQTVSLSDRKDKFSSKDKDKFNITDYENI